MVLRLPAMPDVPLAIKTESVRYDGGSCPMNPSRPHFSVTIESIRQNVYLV